MYLPELEQNMQSITAPTLATIPLKTGTTCAYSKCAFQYNAQEKRLIMVNSFGTEFDQETRHYVAIDLLNLMDLSKFSKYSKLVLNLQREARPIT